MTAKRLLISFAHPDDESFGLGGLIAKYVKEGVEVYLICATNGDVGSIEPELLNGYKSAAELRLAELDCASEKLGFRHVYKLGYKDSGMMGDPSNADPDCLWYQWQHNPANVTRRVVEVMREVRPQVVITFNKYGGYGHPDHIAIQRATVEAFQRAGDSDYVIDDLPPYAVQKLYYNRFPTILMRLRIWQTRLRREDPRRVGRNRDIDLLKILENVEPAHTKVDIKDYVEAWAAASACHKSQGGGLGRDSRLIRLVRLFMGTKQEFTRVHPPPPYNRVDEFDLFANVSIDTERASVL